jgi:hypothetical protein
MRFGGDAIRKKCSLDAIRRPAIPRLAGVAKEPRIAFRI